MNILDYAINTLNLPVKRETANEYSSLCPFCGGKDRFRIFADENRWLCRRCPSDRNTGSLVALIQMHQGLSWREAYEYAGISYQNKGIWVKPGLLLGASRSVFKAKVSPDDVWQKKALEIIDSCHRNLLGNQKVLDWLRRDRGLSLDTAKRFLLGWNQSDQFFESQLWGLNDKKIYLPTGLVIPTFVEGKPVRLKIRRSKVENGCSKYIYVRGPKVYPEVYGAIKDCFIIVESELDAMLLAQESGDLITPIATSGTSNMADEQLASVLSKAKLILLCFDTDSDKGDGIKPGNEAANKWYKIFKNSQPWVVPASYGKDPTEAFLNGFPLRDFVFEGIKYYCPDVSKELCRQTAESGGRQHFIHKEQYDNLILEAVRLIDICDEANRISLEKAINTIESAPNQKSYDFAFAVLEAAIEDAFINTLNFSKVA